MFILVSVVNREALVQAFKTMEEAKEKKGKRVLRCRWSGRVSGGG